MRFLIVAVLAALLLPMTAVAWDAGDSPTAHIELRQSNQDFTGYTEVDPDAHVTVTATRVRAAGLTRQETTRVSSDHGVDYFDLDMRHTFKVTPQAIHYGKAVVWAIANSTGNISHWEMNNSATVAILCEENTFTLYNYETDESDATAAGFWTAATAYYFTVERPSETQVVAKIYSDSARTTVLKVLRVDVAARGRYRWLFVLNADDGGMPLHTISVDIETMIAGRRNVDGHVFTSTTELLNELYGTGHKDGADQAAANTAMASLLIYRAWSRDGDDEIDAGDAARGQSTLDGGINDAVTTLTLASTAGFPTPSLARPEFVRCGTEVIQYRGKTATTLTDCTRGAAGSTAASHSDLAPVVCWIAFETWISATLNGAGATLQDFTGYTEVDPSSHITITTNKLAIVEQSADEDAYVYSDEGAAHFGPTFIHTFKVTLNAEDGGFLMLWGVSNVINDRQYWHNNASEAMGFEIQKSGGSWYFYLRNYESADVDVSTVLPAYSGSYYIRIERENETTLTARIYTDSTYQALFDKLEVTIATGRRHRYLFAMNSFNIGSPIDLSLDIEDLDIGETAYGYDVRGYDSSYLLDDGTEG